jgi:TDG/mug DNA glycosylase family protein
MTLLENFVADDDVLQDMLRPGLRLVICGTAAGPRSAAIGAYYAGRGNKFWQTLHAVGLTPQCHDAEDWRMLDQYGIGFTDLAKRAWGMDKDLPAGSFDTGRLKSLIVAHRPDVLAFNGKTAGRAFLGAKTVEYGRQLEPIGNTEVWIMPSTSGAASGAWSIEPWYDLARQLDPNNQI